MNLIQALGAPFRGLGRILMGAPASLPPSPRPRTGQAATVSVAGRLIGGPAQRYADLEFLGPFDPINVPLSLLKVMREDAQLSIGMRAIKAPFSGITYRVEGGTPEHRAFVQAVMLDAKDLLRRLINTVLLALDYGFSANELIWDIRDVDIDVDGEGGEPARTMRRAYVIKDLFDFDPEDVEIVVDNQGLCSGVVHAGRTFVHDDKLLLATNQPEHRNWWGRSALKPAYRPFYACAQRYYFEDVWFEQKSNPPLIGKAPEDPRYIDPQEALDGQEPQHPLVRLGEQAVNVRSGGFAGLPSDFDPETKQPLWSLEEMSTTNRTAEYQMSIKHLEDLKLRALNVPERLVSQEGVGAYKMVDVHFDVFLGMEEDIRTGLVLPNLTEIAQKLVRFNFGASAVERNPVRIESSEFSRQSRQTLVDFVRSSLGLPLVDAEGNAYKMGELIDGPRVLDVLNVPHIKPHELARRRSGGGDPDAGAPDPAEPPATPEELARFPESAREVGERYGFGAASIRRLALEAPDDVARRLNGRFRFNGLAFDRWLAERDGGGGEAEKGAAA